MARQALTWLDTFPPSEKREKKVVRLLRAGDSAWGVTESQSAFVYPQSLCPLQRIAGVKTDSRAPAGDRACCLEVSELLDEAFPKEEEKDAEAVAVDQGKLGCTSSGGNQDSSSQQDRSDRCGKAASRARSNSEGAISNTGDRGRSHRQRNRFSSRAKETEKGGRDGEGGGGGREGGSGGRGRKGGAGCTTRKLGRPKFYPYGNGNTAPSSGGVVYGEYMLSHSIYPQVLPNKPHTRQVYPETERVAVRAASQARAAKRSGRTARKKPSSVKTRTNTPVPADNIAGGERGVMQRRHVDYEDERGRAVDARGIDEGAGKAGNHDGSCDHGSCSTVFDAVANFSAIDSPEDTNKWCRTRNDTVVTAAATASKERRRNKLPVTEDTPPLSPIAHATGYSTCDHVEGTIDSRKSTPHYAVPSTSPSGASAQVGAQRREEGLGEEREDGRSSLGRPPWTENQRLANDPRNYKFLPRGWAQDFIVPAGVFAPGPSTIEPFLLRGGRLRQATAAGRSALGGVRREEGGVGDCLKWNLNS